MGGLNRTFSSQWQNHVNFLACNIIELVMWSHFFSCRSEDLFSKFLKGWTLKRLRKVDGSCERRWVRDKIEDPDERSYKYVAVLLFGDKKADDEPQSEDVHLMLNDSSCTIENLKLQTAYGAFAWVCHTPPPPSSPLSRPSRICLCSYLLHIANEL